ncbi:MAG: helicase C-terminal domain-containing protein [Gemmatimonadaceae bacterium]
MRAGRCWCTGEDRRDALLKRFREASWRLVAASSFWEGVDVPGDALRALLISRIPFKVPTEPLTAAHCEAITARGEDPFQTLHAPARGAAAEAGVRSAHSDGNPDRAGG